MANKDMFAKWDESIDTEGLAKDVQDAAENGGTFKEVPHGDYEVAVQQMELKASKAGDPMVSIWFKIVGEGEFKGSIIFYNQVVNQGFQVHIANELLRAMVAECEDAPVVEFKTYRQYKDLIMDIFELIDDKFEFALKYGKGKKDFSTFEITEVFALED